MLDSETKKRLMTDPDGLLTYEYIANHIGSCACDINFLIDNMARADRTGQFLISAARYLKAIDRPEFGEAINKLIALGIDKDHDRAYIGALLEQFYGASWRENASELSASDDNFRRIFKRLYPAAGM